MARWTPTKFTKYLKPNFRQLITYCIVIVIQMNLICWVKAGKGRGRITSDGMGCDGMRWDGIRGSGYGQVTSHEIHNYREIAVNARDGSVVWKPWRIATYTSCDLACDPSVAASFYVFGSNCRAGQPFYFS